jgi:hypothetical protein
MRFGRKIIVSLAPLLGLSAFVAAIANAPNPQSKHLLAACALHLATPDIESPVIHVAPEHPSLQAVLEVTVFANTTLRHSVWMVASPSPFLFPVRTLTPLRC